MTIQNDCQPSWNSQSDWRKAFGTHYHRTADSVIRSMARQATHTATQQYREDQHAALTGCSPSHCTMTLHGCIRSLPRQAAHSHTTTIEKI